MKRIKMLLLVNALFLIAFWSLLFVFPVETMRFIMMILGFWLLISWGVTCWLAIIDKNVPYRMMTLITGILNILLAILMITVPSFADVIGKVIVVLLGLVILAKWGLFLFDGLKNQGAWSKESILSIIAGGVLLLLGIFIISNAFLTYIVFHIIFGLSLLFMGITLLWTSLSLKEIEIVEETTPAPANTIEESISPKAE